MLLANGVHKKFGSVTALNGLDLKVEPGEIVGLIGHNGAGKSTFIAVAGGLERADAGTVYVDGIDVTRRPREARSKLAATPQHIALYPHATGAQNLRLFARLGGLRGQRLRTRVNEVTDALGLSDLLDQPVHVLSGGQQRRLQAATALILDPAVLLLDEPTVGADVEARKAILSVVRWQAERGSAICYTTHYLPELEDLQATLAIMAYGKVIARGSRTRLLAGIPAKLRLRFSDIPPADLVATYEDRSVTHHGELTISTFTPVEELAGIIRNFRDMVDSLIGIDVVTPDLDDLYRHLTGQQARIEPQNVY